MKCAILRTEIKIGVILQNWSRKKLIHFGILCEGFSWFFRSSIIMNTTRRQIQESAVPFGSGVVIAV
jgi:hypothetical protein